MLIAIIVNYWDLAGYSNKNYEKY